MSAGVHGKGSSAIPQARASMRAHVPGHVGDLGGAMPSPRGRPRCRAVLRHHARDCGRVPEPARRPSPCSGRAKGDEGALTGPTWAVGQGVRAAETWRVELPPVPAGPAGAWSREAGTRPHLGFPRSQKLEWMRWMMGPRQQNPASGWLSAAKGKPSSSRSRPVTAASSGSSLPGCNCSLVWTCLCRSCLAGLEGQGDPSLPPSSGVPLMVLPLLPCLASRAEG